MLDGEAVEASGPIYREGSRDEAVVLIHGFTGHPGHWLPFSNELSRRGYTVTAPLLPGHGGDADTLARSHSDDWVETARAACRAVSAHRRVHLVGLSMGGMLAILSARTALATTLTVINTPVIMRSWRIALAPAVRPFVERVAATPGSCPDPDLDHLWQPLDQYPTASLVELRKVIRRGWQEAGRLRRPALVIQSDTDETVDPRSGRLLARRLRARLERLAVCRHNALLDPLRPQVHRLILDHLGRDAQDGVETRLA